MFIDDDTINKYQDKYSKWSHPKNLKKSHAVLNYSLFLSLLTNRWWNLFLTSRELLVLDEAHRLEEVIKFTEISISKRRWKRYILDFEIVDYGFDDIEQWLNFLVKLHMKMLIELAEDITEELAVEAKTDIEKLTQAIHIRTQL